MLKKSHRVFAASLTPILFIKPFDSVNISYIPPHFNKIINTAIDNLNEIVYSVHLFDSIVIIGFFIMVFIGSTVPDLDMKLKVFFKNKNERFRYHRQFTHSLLLNLFLMFASLYYLPEYTEYYFLVFAFFFGIFTHLIGDMLTGSIPWLIYGHYGIRFSRIGITVFLPKKLHPIFTEEFPKFLNQNVWAIIFIALLFLNLRIFL